MHAQFLLKALHSAEFRYMHALCYTQLATAFLNIIHHYTAILFFLGEESLVISMDAGGRKNTGGVPRHYSVNLTGSNGQPAPTAGK